MHTSALYSIEYYEVIGMTTERVFAHHSKTAALAVIALILLLRL
jgi:hypothetical protein